MVQTLFLSFSSLKSLTICDTSFGTVATLLEMIPLASMFFMFTNTGNFHKLTFTPFSSAVLRNLQHYTDSYHS